MNCQEARQLLDAYLDGELEVDKCSELEEHLPQCPECPTELTGHREFRAFFKANAPYYRAPAELRAKLVI